MKNIRRKISRQRKPVLKNRPSATDAMNRAINFHNAGFAPQAEMIYKQILCEEPNNADALNLLGTLYSQRGMYGEAVHYISRAISINPRKFEYHNNIGLAFKGLGKFEDAVDAFRKALVLNPGERIYINLGNALIDCRRLDDAITAYRSALTINQDNFKTNFKLGRALYDYGDPVGAVHAFRDAIKVQPDNGDAYLFLALALKVQGRIDEAIIACRQAQKLIPEDARVYQELAGLTSCTENEIQFIEQLQKGENLKDEQGIYLFFAQGKIYEDLGKNDQAFSCYNKANALKRKSLNYDITKDEEFIRTYIDFFNEDVFQNAVTQGYSDETPVFVVGMPRSGTSLVEQIISSHGQVVGIGEREYLARILFKKVKHSDDAKLFSEQMLNYTLNNSMEIGTEYIKEIRSHSDSAKLIINKLPHNFLFIGVIKIVLPGAKIIHCVRDPRDTCLSCYKTLFRGIHEYTYDLTELGRYYRLYQRVMERWHHLLPGYILDVQYEHLVNDPEKNIRRMLDFCDLSWDDACLAPEQNRRNVYTASSVQVRRPIYKSSVHAWRKFAKQLEPLIQQLGET